MTAEHARQGSASDQALMEQVAEGDSRAFEAIYDRYHRQAYSLARRITGGDGGAEEVTQDAFLSLWRGASKFHPERASLSTWLFSLVRHRSIDWLRRGAARPGLQGLVESAAERIEAPERTEEQVMAIQDYDQARRLVNELPPEQREVIDLVYLAGYTQTEIAARVGVPLGTVKGRARLGLRKLRDSAQRESVRMSAA